MSNGEERFYAIEGMFKETRGHDLNGLMELIENWLGPCEEEICECGMVTLGGTSGTEEEVWEWTRITENWATVRSEDLRLILSLVNRTGWPPGEGVEGAYERLKEEVEWWDQFKEENNDQED